MTVRTMSITLMVMAILVASSMALATEAAKQKEQFVYIAVALIIGLVFQFVPRRKLLRVFGTAWSVLSWIALLGLLYTTFLLP